MEKIVERNKCTGCKMCADVCTTGAISYQADMEGFWYPVIDPQKCTDCRLCQNACPQAHAVENRNDIPTVYAAWIRNDAVRYKSTSGGIFYALAEEVIRQGGYVVGCRYADDCKSAFHEIVHTMEDLERLIGSKYFQSDTGSIYRDVKRLLEQKEKVLFCGSPCQIAAMLRFLGREYENLITMDYICLGINSPRAYRAYVTEQEEKYKSNVRRVQFKNKKLGWQSLATFMEFSDGKIYRKDKDRDLWVKGYILKNLYMRPSCYQCNYRNQTRIADFSVGDYWGITHVSRSNLKKGVSVVLVSSKKADELFQRVKGSITYRKSTMEQVTPGNPALYRDPEYTKQREYFFDILGILPFSKAVALCCMEGTMAKLAGKIAKGSDILSRIRQEKPFEYLEQMKLIEKTDLAKFIYYNYFSPNIERDKNVYLIPYKNCMIEMDKTAKLYIRNRNIQIGIYKFQKSKAETYFKMGKKAVWISNGGAGLAVNASLEICDRGRFESGYWDTNSGCVIVCAKRIVFGENVMLGRNNLIYDSDHHRIKDENDRIKNQPKDVWIGDNVWLTSNVAVLKGARIESGSIIGAHTVVTGDVPCNAFVVNGTKAKIINQKAKWVR